MKFLLFYITSLWVSCEDYWSFSQIEKKNPLSYLFEKILDLDTEVIEEEDVLNLNNKEEEGIYLMVVYILYFIISLVCLLFQKIIFIYLLLSIFLCGINSLYYHKILGYIGFFIMGSLQLLLTLLYFSQIISGNTILLLFLLFYTILLVPKF